MAIQVKICGIASAEAADAAARAGADFAGLVFHSRSPRHLTPQNAAQLAARLRGKVHVVALLSDPKDEEIAAVIAAAQPEFIQLHGSESPERVADLRARFGTAVIKAIHVADSSDMACVPSYESAADMLLFDAKAPALSTREGGHGAPFDWRLLRGRTFRRPWLLAGGLNPENVACAVRAATAPGVDVSSGVEKSPGVKDVELIGAFVRAARAAEFSPEAQS